MSPDINLPGRTGNIPHAFTVDLEDWYHGLTRTNPHPETWSQLTTRAEINTNRLLDLLDENQVKATFFVLGDQAEKSPHLIQRIAKAGHELGSHGYTHRPLWKLDRESFRVDIKRTRDFLQELTGMEVLGYRAPYFSLNQNTSWAFEILEQEGYAYDSSVFPLRTILYGYPGAKRTPYRPLDRANLVEFPIATLRWLGLTIPIAGGFYSRMLPYRFVRYGLTRLSDAGESAILYMHPWELDVQQPRIPVSLRERLTHFGGRATLEGKLRQLFHDFALAPLGEVYHHWLAAHPNQVENPEKIIQS